MISFVLYKEMSGHAVECAQDKNSIYNTVTLHFLLNTPPFFPTYLHYTTLLLYLCEYMWLLLIDILFSCKM